MYNSKQSPPPLNSSKNEERCTKSIKPSKFRKINSKSTFLLYLDTNKTLRQKKMILEKEILRSKSISSISVNIFKKMILKGRKHKKDSNKIWKFSIKNNSKSKVKYIRLRTRIRNIWCLPKTIKIR